MSRGSGWRAIIVLATPVVISKLSFTAMGIVDTAMVGHLGPTEQGAVGLATTLMFTLYVFGLGLVGVVNTYVSQHHGAGKPERCGEDLGAGLRMAVVVASVTWGVLMLSAPTFKWVGLGEGISELGYRYLFFRGLGIAGVFGYWAYNGYMEGLGHTRTPMLITIAANIVNICLDYALIFGIGPIPAMGVDGAGLATGLSNLFMLGCFVAVVHGRPLYKEFGAARVAAAVRWSRLKDMVRVGLPMGFQFFIEVGAFLVMTIIIGWLGDVALAANQVALRLMSISFMTAWGIGIAATTLVGRHQGEGRPDLAMLAGRRTIALFLVVGTFCALLYNAAPWQLVGLFSPYPEVQQAAVQLLIIAAIFQMFDGINMVSYGALKGAGDTRWPLIAVTCVSWGIGIPLTFALAFPAGLGIAGAWIASTVMIALEAALLYGRFHGGRWKTIQLVDSDPADPPATPRLDTRGASGTAASRRTA